MANQLTTVFRTPASSSGLTLVEEYLYKTYERNETYNTVLANSAYASKRNLPKRSGQFVKFTKRERIRSPEAGAEGADPASGATLSYTQFQLPIEFIKEFLEISYESGVTSWIDLAKDAHEELSLALKRYLHYSAQAAFWIGRYTPGKRDSNGVCSGSPYFPFWTTAAASPTLYGQSFTFPAAPRYYGGGRPNFAALQADDYATMRLFSHIKTRLANARAPRIKNGYVCVISDAIQADLLKDPEYREAVLAFEKKSSVLFEGHVSTFDGIHFVIDDDPMSLALGGGGLIRMPEFTGNCHTFQMFGQDAFGYLRLGGKNAARPTFKVQDISKTGSMKSIGYTIPHQVAIIRATWAACGAVPVRDPEANA